MNYFLYYILLCVWCMFSLLPLRIHYIISDFLFWLLYKVIGYRRRVVWKNLSASFPEKSQAELKDIECGFYHFLCDYFVETVKMMTISKKEIKKRMVFKGIEDLDEVIESGQSIALYLGHYCNWEWVTSMPLWVTPKVQCGQIYHPLENKYFDKLLLRSRQRLDALCISMQDTLREVVRYKREGQPIMIGYISDQAPNWVNIHHWVDFLNQDTPVFTGTERIVKKMNHAVFYVDMRRIKRGYYEAEFKLMTRDPKELEDFKLTDMYFDMLEKSIRRVPEFWLWSHNRWKRTRKEFNERFEVIDGKVIAKGHTD
ncbi:MAG: lysophospholipid acyltransferase family protein [Prevotella sp.]|nr:lysophospholipid acyltransferase family protein [Prevotella sp.]